MPPLAEEPDRMHGVVALDVQRAHHFVGEFDGTMNALVAER